MILHKIYLYFVNGIEWIVFQKHFQLRHSRNKKILKIRVILNQQLNYQLIGISKNTADFEAKILNLVRRGGSTSVTIGGSGRNRTGTGLPPQDFESSKSTNFITEPLFFVLLYKTKSFEGSRNFFMIDNQNSHYIKRFLKCRVLAKSNNESKYQELTLISEECRILALGLLSGLY